MDRFKRVAEGTGCEISKGTTQDKGVVELSEQQAKQLSFSVELPLTYNTHGKVLSGDFANYCTIVKKDPYLDGRIRLNLLDGRPEARGFYWNTSPHPFEDADLFQLMRYISEVYEISNDAKLRQAVQVAAWDGKYHPIRDLLYSLKWDGVERIHNLFPRFLGAERSEYVSAVTDLLFAGAIQRVVTPGVKFDYCAILADHQQGTGKSTLCRLLALRPEWFTDSISDLSDPKRAYESIRGKWVIEIGELLAVRRAKDIEGTKAFITRQSDVYRDPYGVYPSDRKRQCIFIGTTNQPRFLPEDRTGNRRFLPVICNGDRAEVHPAANELDTAAYIIQCYAEAISRGLDKAPLVIDPKFDEVLRQVREGATPEDTRIGMIQRFLDDWDEEFVCTRLIWDKVFAGEHDRQPTRQDLRDIADIMTLSVDGWIPYKTEGRDRYPKKHFTAYGYQRAWQRAQDFTPYNGDFPDTS